MAEKEVIIRIKAIEDDLVDSLERVEKESKSAAAASESAFEGIQEAAKTVSIVVTGINQALELVGKGFDYLKNSILGPLDRMNDLVGVGGEFVRAYEDAAQTTTESGKALDELDRNLARLKSTIGGAIAATPEFSAALDALNATIDETIDLIANNLPDVTALFGGVIEYVAAGAIQSVERIRFAFDALVANIERVVSIAKFFGLIDDPIDDVRDNLAGLADDFETLGDRASISASRGLSFVVDKLTEIQTSGDQSSARLEEVRDLIVSIADANPQSIDLLSVSQEAVEQLDQMIEKAIALEEAGVKVQTATDKITGAFENLGPKASDILGDLRTKFDEFLQKRREQFATDGSGVDLNVSVRVDDSELERFQRETDRARKSFDVLRQQLERGVTPKFEGNVGELIPQFEQIGEEIKQIFLSLPDDDLGLAQTFITATDAAKDFLAAFGTNGVGPALDALDIVQDEIEALRDTAPEVADRFDDLREKIAAVAEGIEGVDGATVDVKIQTSDGTTSPAAAATILGDAIEDAGTTAEESFGEAANAVRDAADELTSSTIATNAASSALTQSALETQAASAESLEAARSVGLAAEQSTEAALAISDAGSAFAELLRSGNSAESGALIGAAGDLRGAASDQKGAARDLVDAAARLKDAANTFHTEGSFYGGDIYSGQGLDNLVTVLGQLLVSRFALTTEYRG